MTIEIQNLEERRTTPRYGVDLPASLWSEPTEGDADPAARLEILSGQVRDVSWGGLFISTAATQRIGTAVSLLVNMPQHREPVPLRGRVAWISSGGQKGRGIGVQLETSL